jgi:dihydroorotate dehydrogenase
MKRPNTDLEQWHDQTRAFLQMVQPHPDLFALSAQFPSLNSIVRSKRLETSIAGIRLANPLMVGAGWDKSGVAVRALHEIGFAGVEVGSVQNYPQPGNPQPRHLELSPGVTINRYGFNSPGAQEVAENLKQYKSNKIVIGVNIGRNKDIPDIATLHLIAATADKLLKYASYFVINVSSPNTPGLRRLQSKEPLSEIIKAVNQVVSRSANKPPVFIKISPDLSKKDVDALIDTVINNRAQGIIAANTTTNKKIKARYGKRWPYEAGGLSGNDEAYRTLTTKLVAHIYRQTKGKLAIIGVGGVHDTLTTIEKIQAGACAVQMVTAIKYEGLGVANSINHGLLDWMDRNGVKNIGELIGTHR